MITRDEALARARSWTADLWPENTPEPGMHEFPLGWVVWPMPTTPPDPTQAPSSTGGPQIVIDRETGDLSRWPSIPASAIAEKYTALKAAGDRFPPDVRQALDDAGWFPGRDISAAVDQWEMKFADRVAGMTFFPAARAAMREFGALSIPQAGPTDGGYRTHIFPTHGGVGIDRAEGFMADYEHAVFPLGNNQDGPTELVMDEQGRVFFLHWAQDFYLGENIDAALISLIRWGDWPDVSSSIWEDDNDGGQPPSARMNE
jgi:SUKH-3 immunity protein of toxin-antitoxin system